ncbi:MAG: dockerin type I domain-containing protein [Phycisphaerales bacterium]
MLGESTAPCGGPARCDPFCVGDVNGKTWVDAEDLARLLANWGPCDPAEPCYADFNGDGVVNEGDLAQVLGGWGRCPGW